MNLRVTLTVVTAVVERPLTWNAPPVICDRVPGPDRMTAEESQ
ncbi:hypothetical protein [Sphingomonas sp. ERG5]|nr:hypothetical protein [Sphingomonas sp. ERG5]